MRLYLAAVFSLAHWLIVFPVYSQVEGKIQYPSLDSLNRKDTLQKTFQTTPIDTVDIAEKPVFSESQQTRKKGGIDTTIFYSAKDSIRFSLKQNITRLYGNAKIKYGKIELEANEITIDNNKSIIYAKGEVDSLGRRVGFPLFTDGGEVYETRDIVYNFKSKRAKISEVVTKQGEGFMHGEKVFKSENNELYTLGNSYTTCNLTHPHFRIVSKKAKMIPGDKIVTGPFYMEINDVPMPLGFAFGAFPLNESSSSGIIFPKYGEEGRRGFFLTGLGYYFDISEYIKLKITGDIYTKGATAGNASMIYRKRYAYNGSLQFSYTNNRQNYNIENTDRQADYSIIWRHSSDAKRSSRFSASVNIASSTYTSNNLLDLKYDPNSSEIDNTTRKLSSSISYSKTFSGTPLSIGIDFRHNQDLVTEQVDLTLPSITFNVKNVYPFKKFSDNEFLEKLSIRYTLSATQQITNLLGRIQVEGISQNNILPFDGNNIPLFLEKAKRSIQHTLPISSSLKIFKHFIINPSFNYTEDWYFEKFNWGLNEAGNGAVVLDTLQEFGRVYNYSTGVNLTTRIYGTYLFKNGSIKAIRHTVNPSIGYSYAPNFGDVPFDFFQTVTTTDNREIKQFQYTGRAPSQQETSALTFGIGNSIEMKVKNAKDSVEKKISILKSLSISSRYNFAVDSFNLAPFALSANTNILQGKLNINVTATLDPYQYLRTSDVDENAERFSERRVNRLVWEGDFSFGRITRASLAISTNLSPKGRQKDNANRDKIVESNLLEQEKNFLIDHPSDYIDFDIPWNLRLNYNLSYTRSLGQKEKVVKTLRVNGDISLTKKWKITFNSGYDFDTEQVTQTHLSINRDLHCWKLSFGWVPFGKFQSYDFTIGIKSGVLKDLKLDRNRSFFDN